MKLLSVAVPCYNSQAYMRNCVDSLLEGGDLVEILIVDDGSKDDTGKIADEYAAKYPNIVRAIHQENGGHGEAVNTGIRNATGLYFKVVDSDDWVNAEAYHAILDKLQEITGGPQVLDMMISNFVYEKQGAKRKKIMKYTKYMPEGRIFTWKEMGKMPLGKYILMHSVIYRTGLLRECELVLPKHTFYVDNLFVYQPLPSVRTMYYMDVNFYRYLTRSPKEAAEILGEIQGAGRLAPTGLVNNSNLSTETTWKHLEDTQPQMEELRSLTGLPIAFTAVKRDLAGKVPEGLEKIYPIDVYVKAPWNEE